VTPKVQEFALDGFHRLIPSRYSEIGTVLGEIAESDAMLEDLVLLDGATNDRIQGEQQGLTGISTYELVYGIPSAHIVNAAFTHASETGGRFNDSTRGAWYAAEELETSLAEVTYHKARRLGEMVVPEMAGGRPDEESSTYDDWLSDFRASFHVLKRAEGFFADCLQAEPVPQCYAASQLAARRLLEMQSNGLVYPSVRRKGRCLACFRPALVYHPRQGARLEIHFKARKARKDGYEHRVRFV
jgi:hypothetical protein